MVRESTPGAGVMASRQFVSSRNGCPPLRSGVGDAAVARSAAPVVADASGEQSTRFATSSTDAKRRVIDDGRSA